MVQLVTRDEWHARNPNIPPLHMNLPSPRLWLHHTATFAWHGKSGVRSCQDFHMDVKRWNDIGYSFLADQDGTIYVGRGPGIIGAHTEGDNSKSHAICAMGDFQTGKPTSKLIYSLAALIQYGHKQGWWPDRLTGGHRDAPQANTDCPGDNLYDEIPEINKLALGDDLLTDQEHEWLGRIHHEVAFGDTSGKTVTQMLQEILAGQSKTEARLKAIEDKIS